VDYLLYKYSDEAGRNLLKGVHALDMLIRFLFGIKVFWPALWLGLRSALARFIVLVDTPLFSIFDIGFKAFRNDGYMRGSLIDYNTLRGSL